MSSDVSVAQPPFTRCKQLVRQISVTMTDTKRSVIRPAMLASSDTAARCLTTGVSLATAHSHSWRLLASPMPSSRDFTV